MEGISCSPTPNALPLRHAWISWSRRSLLVSVATATSALREDFFFHRDGAYQLLRPAECAFSFHFADDTPTHQASRQPTTEQNNFLLVFFFFSLLFCFIAFFSGRPDDLYPVLFQ
jgi:hypothetical protein